MTSPGHNELRSLGWFPNGSLIHAAYIRQCMALDANILGFPFATTHACYSKHPHFFSVMKMTHLEDAFVLISIHWDPGTLWTPSPIHPFDPLTPMAPLVAAFNTKHLLTLWGGSTIDTAAISGPNSVVNTSKFGVFLRFLRPCCKIIDTNRNLK